MIDQLPSTSPTRRDTMNGKPVHHVPAQSVINFDSGFGHKLLCDKLTFTAGSACAYSCSFCYVEDLMKKSPHVYDAEKKTPRFAEPFTNMVIRRDGAAEAARKQLTDRNGKPKFNDPNDSRVIYASPLVDVAANMELVRETVEICAVILLHTHWQIRLLSKSNLLPKVAELLELRSDVRDSRERIIYGVSTGTLDDKLAAAFEAGTPLVSKRIASLHWLQDHGFRTFGMICPSLPIPFAGAQGSEFIPVAYRHFAKKMADAIRADRCEHVWAEVINARGESFTRTYDALKSAGYHDQADELRFVSTDKEAWERYARATFEAHAAVYGSRLSPIDSRPVLRFLQYVTAASKPWWTEQVPRGAVLL